MDAAELDGIFTLTDELLTFLSGNIALDRVFFKATDMHLVLPLATNRNSRKKIRFVRFECDGIK